MLTPRQADAVASSLLTKAERDRKPTLQCPSCGALSLSLKARRKLHPFWDMQCQAWLLRSTLSSGACRSSQSRSRERRLRGAHFGTVTDRSWSHGRARA